MNRKLIGKVLFPSLVAGVLLAGIIALSCGGANPAFAPFGSTVEILDPPGDTTIPDNSLTTRLVQAQVLGPDGEPLNDVRVIWIASFAGQNDFVVDTNGDGVSDARAVQLVNDKACSPQRCSSTPITEWFSMGAFVDSPFDILTDNRGIAFVIILLSGEDIINPAFLEASTDSGSVDVVEFSVNAN
ncbi:MAG: hypothetical protein RIG61_02020 [Deltaproteobacteria bacterium]